MRPTSWRALVATALVAAVLAYLAAELAYGSLPPLPRTAPLFLVSIAMGELVLRTIVRDRVQRSARPGARPLHPIQVARAAALAKATSPTGALLGGAYAGLLAWTLPRSGRLAAARDDALVAGLSVLCAAAVVGAALLLERACRLPPEDEDDAGYLSRSPTT